MNFRVHLFGMIGLSSVLQVACGLISTCSYIQVSMSRKLTPSLHVHKNVF